MKTIALTNQKGGVGKTTSTINIGAGLAKLGKKVLLIDLDPQANLTYSLKMHSNRMEKNIYHALKGQAKAHEAIINHKGFDFIPSSLELSGAELELANEPAREGLLKNVLDQLKEDEYDFVLIDCPPNLGLLTLNAFTAVEDVFIVLQSEYLALHGLSKLLDLIKIVQQRLNNRLEVGGIICTLYDNRKNLNKEVVGHIKDYFGSKVFKTIIRDNVALAEAPSHHKTIFEYDGNSNGAHDYFALAKRNKELPLRNVQKPSMGHNPLAYSLKNHASFDFIRNTQNKDEKDVNSSSKSKKVTSYYLEEEIIDYIRVKATQENSSFSGVANEMLKNQISEENKSE